MLRSTVSDGANGRTLDGKFARGNAGGPGNKLQRRYGEIRLALSRSATPAEAVQILAKVRELAVNDGDINAAKLWLSYVAGMPPQAVEIEERGGWSFEDVAEVLEGVCLRLAGDTPQARVRVAEEMGRLANLLRSAGDNDDDDDSHRI